MREVSIVREKLGIASCNVCYARNYDPDAVNALGVYKENLYDLHIGSMTMCMCKDCLKLIGQKIAVLDVVEDESAKEE